MSQTSSSPSSFHPIASWKQCIPEPLMILDAFEGKLLFANELIALFLGYSVSELMEKRIMDLDLHIADILTWQIQTAALKHNGRVVTKSLYRTKEGENIPVEVASLFCHEGTDCVVCIVHDISQYTEQTEKISISLHEKEHLLKEIHHRVKNNLQTISSLLSLGRKKIKDASVSSVLQESQNRIYAIASVHEILYKSDKAGRVDMSKYIRYLTNSLIDTFGLLATGVTVNLKIEPLFFLMETAMPCGLIINELVTNAIQHAFSENFDNKTIEILLKYNGKGQIALDVTDNGIGFNPDKEDDRISVGLKLVNILAKQLDGELTVTMDHGMKFQLIFNAPETIGENEK